MRGESDDLLLEVVSRDELFEHDDALAAEFGCWCVDCGERWCGVLAGGDVVVADNSEFVRHGDAEFTRCAQNADGE